MKTEKRVPFQWVSLESKWLFEEKEIRLNAGSYSFDIIKGKKLIELIRKKTDVAKIEEFAEKIFVGARVKRLFTTEEMGIPYLMPIDLFLFHLKPRKWVRKETKDLENWWVNPLTILITQSGTPGRCLLVNELFKDKVVSPNVVRVFPNNDGLDIIDYIYAFLSTWIGQAFLTKTQYGATVKHIEPYHVGSILFPLLPESDIKEINSKIFKVYKLREKAQELLLKAQELFYSELELPKIQDKDVPYLNSKGGKVAKVFITQYQQIDSEDLRLNASSYLPIFFYVKKILEEKEKERKFSLRRMKSPDISLKIFTPPRFKRIYVDPMLGIPLLQGSHIPLIKYLDIKFIWKKMKGLENYIIKKDWILVTCSGTIGKVSLVTKYTDGWAATNHMTRIIPSDQINVGYLILFLHSVYGQVQVQILKYGGVVEEIGEAGKLLSNVLVPVPSRDIQEKLGKLVTEAYEKKDQANIIEQEAIKLLENKIEELAK